MSNTIKLKRGSGSDPSASDLSIGEIAIRTDSGKLFTKKDNGSVAEISGSGGIDDGDKGDITVSNGGDTFTIDNNAITTAKIADVQVTTSKLVVNAVTENRITDGAVTSAKIADGTIVNADINSSAAIAGSKISPNFGSQNISTTGTLGSGNITISSTAPKIIFTDSNNNPDYQLINEGGTFLLYDSTNGVDKVKVQADGHIDITPNTDFANGIDVTGNVEITSGDVLIYDQHPSIRFTDSDAPSGYGHVGVNNTSGSLVLRSDDGNALSGTFMGFEIDGSPKMRLDNTGLGIGTNSPSQKLDVVGNIAVSGTVDGVDIAARNTLFGGLTSSSGVLTNGVTATTQSAGNNTTRVATTAFVSTAISNLINGAPSALDTLNELAAAMNDDAAFSTTVTNSLATKMPLAGGQFTGNITFSGTQTVDGRDLSVDGSKLDGIESGATADQTASEILTLIKTVDGAGSGLDADTLDGYSQGNFVRTDGTHTCSGKITFSDGIVLPTTGDGIKFGAGSATNDDAHIEWLGGSNTGYLRISTSDDSDSSGQNEYIEFGDYATQNKVGTFTQHLRISRDRFLVRTGSDSISQADRLNIDSSGTVDIYGNLDVGAGIDVTGNISCSGTVDGRDLATDGSKLDGIESGATADQSASEILTLIKTVDGAGSGLDADTLDGISSASFVRSDAADTISGDITFTDSGAYPVVIGSASGMNDARLLLRGSSNPYIRFREGNTDKAYIQWNSNGNFYFVNQESGEQLLIGSGSSGLKFVEGGSTRSVYHTGNLSVGDGGLTSNNFTDSDHSKLDGIEASATADQTASEILTLIKTVDGAGSGLDADTLDGVSSASFLRSDTADTMTGNFSLHGNLLLTGDATTTNQDRTISFTGFDKESTSDFTDNAFIRHTTNTGGLAGSVLEIGSVNDSNDGIAFNTNGHNNNLRLNSNIIWNAGNDGSGSGLDSDLLDGQEGSYYRNAGNINAGTLPTARLGTLPQRIGLNTSVGNTPASRNAFLALGDSDTGVAQNGDGQLEFWANNQEIMNLDTGEIEVYKQLRPGTDSSFSLGTSSHRWSNLYADTLYGAGSNITSLNASNISSGTIAAARVATLNQNTTGSSGSCTGNAATATKLATARNIAGVSFDGSANISLNNNAITNGAGYITSSNSAITNKLPLAGGTMTGELQINARLDVGTGSGNDHEIRIYKGDNNVSDHIQFYNGTTRIGEIGCEDGTWLRINQETAKNIYTPRYIRADAGFFVDGTSKGINGSGNFIGGTIAGASDYSTLLRSNAADTATGDITFSGGAGAVTIAANSDIRLTTGNWTGDAYGKIQQHANRLYLSGGSNANPSIVLRYSGSDRIYMKSDGTLYPSTDSASDLGVSNYRWANGYFDTLYGDGSNLTGISAGATGGGSDEVFYENGQTVTTNYTITNGKNAMAAGPITINSGVTVTVGSGETLTIV